MLVIFLQIVKESKSVFFCGGGGGGGGREGVVAGGGRGLLRVEGGNNVQMFKMALLLFKEYKCAKLF